MALIEVLYKYNPSVVGVCRDMLGFMGVMGIAFLFGVTIGWLWKPRWVNSNKLNCFLSNFFDSSFSSPPFRPPTQFEDNCTSSVFELNEEHSNISSLVTEEDLEHLYQLVEKKDGGSAWVSMMDCAKQSMAYRARRRNPKKNLMTVSQRTLGFQANHFYRLRQTMNSNSMLPEYEGSSAIEGIALVRVGAGSSGSVDNCGLPIVGGGLLIVADLCQAIKVSVQARDFLPQCGAMVTSLVRQLKSAVGVNYDF